MDRKEFLKLSSGAALGLSAAPSVFSAPNRPLGKPVFRMLVASDGHYGQADTPYEQYLDELVSALNKEKADLVVVNGDLSHDEPKFLVEVKKKLDALKFPYRVSRGNHDRMEEAEWKSLWGYGSNAVYQVPEQEVACVIAATSSIEGEYQVADIEFLEQSLSKLQAVSTVFVFLHISQRTWTKFGVDGEKVCALLEDSPKVKAVFHGHDHVEDNVKIIKHTPFLFTGHYGGSWGTDYRGYRVVELDKEGHLSTYQVSLAGEKVNSFMQLFALSLIFLI